MKISSLKTVKLHGKLGADFGESYEFDAKSPRQVIRALGMQMDGFVDALSQGNYQILMDGMPLSTQMLSLTFGKSKHLDIIPVVEGASGGGKSILIGLSIIAAAFTFGSSLAVTIPGLAGTVGAGTTFTTAAGAGLFGGLTAAGAQFAGIGLAIAASGVAQALTPTPKVANIQDRERPENRPSSLLSSQVNATESGAVHPIVYGFAQVGSVLGNASITTEKVALSLVLADQIDEMVFYDMTTEAFSLPIKSLEATGYADFIVSGDKVEGIDWTKSTFGSLDPKLFRSSFIPNIVEFMDTGTDEYFFEVYVTGKGAPQDWFDIITVTTPDEQTTHLQLTTVTADSVIYENVQNPEFPSGGGDPTFQRVGITKWIWNRGAGVGFAIPTGVATKVRIDY